MSAFVVYYRGDVYGPFASRETADRWIAEHVRITVPLGEMASWEIWPLNVPVDAEANAAERGALDRVRAEIHDWPAADFWHRDAILRALRGS